MHVPLRRRHALTVISIGVVLSVGLGACGGDSDDDAAGTTGATVSTPLVTAPDDGGGDATDDPGTDDVTTDRDEYVAEAADVMSMGDDELSLCLAGSVVDAIGMDRIVDAGLTPEEFARASDFEEMGLSVTPEEAAALEGELVDCGDLVEGVADNGLSEQQAECVRAELTNELAAEMIVVDLAGLPVSDELQAARDAASSCMTGAPTTT